MSKKIKKTPGELIKLNTKREYTKPVQHRVNWYTHEHIKRWQFKAIDWLIPKIQDLYDNKYNLSRSSSFARTIPIEFAKLYISLDRVNTICTIFKVEKISK